MNFTCLPFWDGPEPEIVSGRADIRLNRGSREDLGDVVSWALYDGGILVGMEVKDLSGFHHWLYTNAAEDIVIDGYFTTEEVARQTGLSVKSIQIYRTRYGIGRKFGRDLFFTQEEINHIRERMKGGHHEPE